MVEALDKVVEALVEEMEANITDINRALKEPRGA